MNVSVHQTEATLVAVLSQLIVIVLAARLAGNAAVAIRQPRAVGEIVAGLMLGPSLFGALLPGVSASLFTDAAATPMLVLSQIGLILLMFQIGSDFEFAHLKGAANRRGRPHHGDERRGAAPRRIYIRMDFGAAPCAGHPCPSLQPLHQHRLCDHRRSDPRAHPARISDDANADRRHRHFRRGGQ